MQRLLTISYPAISAESAAFIDAFRQRHDARRHAMVQAHFTLVFGCAAIGLSAYTNHVAQVARASRPIEFSCRSALLGTDDEEDTAYVFLVPDEGSAEISQLHDRLHKGLLQPHLRLDLPYLPHITIGAMASRAEAQALCDELKRQAVCVQGRLTTLVVGCIEAGRFNNLSLHPLDLAGMSTRVPGSTDAV